MIVAVSAYVYGFSLDFQTTKRSETVLVVPSIEESSGQGGGLLYAPFA